MDDERRTRTRTRQRPRKAAIDLSELYLALTKKMDQQIAKAKELGKSGERGLFSTADSIGQRKRHLGYGTLTLERDDMINDSLQVRVKVGCIGYSASISGAKTTTAK